VFADLLALPRVVACAIALVAATAHAQSGLDAQCPNASATLDALAFPLDLPATTKSGEVVVEFTIGADGSIGEATATSASDPAFAPAALAAVKRLSCKPRPAAQRYSLPISFAKPEALSSAICANYPLVLQGLELPRSVVQSGVRRGDVVVEFTLQASGQPTDFVVLRSNSRELAAQAVRALEDLKCAPSPRPRQVRVPVSFKID
jgi:TonB family protein